MPRLLGLLTCAALLFTGCGDDPAADAGEPDATTADGGPDAGFDAGLDAGEDREDAGFDAGPGDAGRFDGGPPERTRFPPRDFRCPAGASRPCRTDVPLTTDDERTVEVARDMPSATYSFVIRTWSMPRPSFAGTVAGFNLDGLDSGGGSSAPAATCEEIAPDYDSLRDPGHEGVDNAFSELIGPVEDLLDPDACPGMTTMGCLDARLAARVADGSFLILVELTGVDSFAYDSSVDVTLHEVTVDGGGPPRLDGDGRLTSGQTFASVRTLGAATGDVFDGRLRVVFGTRVELPASAALLVPIELDGMELRATVRADELRLGAVGATTEVESIVAQARAMDPGLEATIRAVLHEVADVSPTSDPTICARVSSGYSFDAVSASLR